MYSKFLWIRFTGEKEKKRDQGDDKLALAYDVSIGITKDRMLEHVMSYMSQSLVQEWLKSVQPTWIGSYKAQYTPEEALLLLFLILDSEVRNEWG